MLDQRLIRENPRLVEEKLSERGISLNLSNLQQLTIAIKNKDTEISNLKSESNKISKSIGNYYQNPKDSSLIDIEELKKNGNNLKSEISKLEQLKRELNKKIIDEILKLPNFPSENTPKGRDENQNIEIRKWGNVLKKENIKSHWEIGEELNLFDTKRTSKISKSRFITLIGNGARLERALINFMLDSHQKNGYLELMPPALINSDSLRGSGQLPKFSNESFKCDEDDLWLSPTAEVPLTAFHKDEIIDQKLLPLKYVAYSPCFRREAGSYGKDTKGMIRQHQFYKVEMVSIVEKENCLDELERMTNCATDILDKLELPYRKIILCSGDMGFSAEKTYDIEVWLPSENRYREISSCSSCSTFQAVRMKSRYKNQKKETLFVGTLNGSGLAIGRTLIAILENYQQKDGSIRIPKILQPYMNNLEKMFVN